MEQSFTLQQVRNHLASTEGEGGEVGAIDDILTILLVITPAVTGLTSPIGQLAIALLAVKGEMARAAQHLFDGLRRKRKNLPAGVREQRLIALHTLAFYSAFLEAAEQQLPAVSDQFAPDEALEVLRGHVRALSAQTQGAPKTAPEAHLRIPLPHPAHTFESHTANIRTLYEPLCRNALTTVTKALERSEFLGERLNTFTAAAAERYRTYYVDLALENHDFFVWSTLEAAQLQQAQLEKLQELVMSYGRTIEDESDASAQSLLSLEMLVRDLPKDIDAHRVGKVLTGLSNLYDGDLHGPIVKDYVIRASDGTELHFPSARDVFVPQPFSVITYQNERLEDEATWANCAVQNGLGAFLSQYLGSPYSETSPLIILGHPGSGKSLLTTIVAGRLTQANYTAVRVELRSVAADTEVATQVEASLRRRLNISVSWGDLAETFERRPGLLLLDGYDELLQVTGRAHGGYLTRVQQFQMNELAVRKRPVRAIVTSRLNLIDNATIPCGATILRLREFDEVRRAKWIDAWNRCNATYFATTGFSPFRLPQDEAVLDLARQPLLLLMLALYDADGNALHVAEKLTRAKLYDRLIRRFIERETDKKQSDEPSLGVDANMQRLAIPAIGMFNRRTVSLSERDLNADLQFFGAAGPPREGLSPASHLIGSFFFIHRAQAINEERIGETAVEYLHNTFGEFLTADLLLRRVVHECKRQEVLASDSYTADDVRNRMALTGWHPLFAITPLITRPVIVQMLQEALPLHLDRTSMTRETFERRLRTILGEQVTAAVSGDEPFDPTAGVRASTFPRAPFLQHLSTYTLNLVTLGALLCRDGFTLGLSTCPSPEEGISKWRRILGLWQSWFSTETLLQFGSIVTSKAVPDGMHFISESNPWLRREDALSKIAAAAEAIGDDLTAGLAWFVAALEDGDHMGHGAMLLADEGFDVEAQYAAAALSHARNRFIDTQAAEVLLDAAISVIESRKGLALPLTREATEFALAVGLSHDRLTYLQFVDDQAHAESDSIPVRILVRSVDNALDRGGNLDKDKLAAHLQRLHPASLCPRLLVACIRLASHLRQKAWLDALYEELIKPNPPTHLPRWAAPGVLSPEAMLDLMSIAAKRSDLQTAAMIYQQQILPYLLSVFRSASIERMVLASVAAGDDQVARTIGIALERFRRGGLVLPVLYPVDSRSESRAGPIRL